MGKTQREMCQAGYFSMSCRALHVGQLPQSLAAGARAAAEAESRCRGRHQVLTSGCQPFHLVLALCLIAPVSCAWVRTSLVCGVSHAPRASSCSLPRSLPAYLDVAWCHRMRS